MDAAYSSCLYRRRTREQAERIMDGSYHSSELTSLISHYLKGVLHP